MTVLIDSRGWIGYWKGGKSAKKVSEYIEGSEESIVSAINVAEIYFWVARYYNDEIAKTKLRTVEKRSYVIPVQKELAVEAGKIRIESKLALADSLIVANARRERATIVTGDPDMKSLENVIFVA
jgi:toxin FitB